MTKVYFLAISKNIPLNKSGLHHQIEDFWARIFLDF